MNTQDVVKAPFHVYAFAMYMAWDRDQTMKPPKGFRSWMEYREHIRGDGKDAE